MQIRNLEYYLQPGSAGREEAFAELFGVILGGGSELSTAKFMKGFPETIRTIKTFLEQWE